MFFGETTCTAVLLFTNVWELNRPRFLMVFHRMHPIDGWTVCGRSLSAFVYLQLSGVP